MADDIQQMLEAVRRASGGSTSTTAVAEPEEESSPEKQPALGDMLKAIRAANLPKPPKEDLSEAAPRIPRPAMVRGPFGTPIPPLSIAQPPAPSVPGYTATDQYGASPTSKDTSGQPFLSYWDKMQQQWTTDKTRTAFKVDPVRAQKLNPSILKNGRMPEAESSAIKKALGGNYSEELDHKIALELGGSNASENLQLEENVKGTENTATDPLENSLAKQVAGGQVSWVDAQRQLAKAKGFRLPEDKETTAVSPAEAYANATDAERLGQQPTSRLAEQVANLDRPMIPMEPPTTPAVRGPVGEPDAAFRSPFPNVVPTKPPAQFEGHAVAPGFALAPSLASPATGISAQPGGVANHLDNLYARLMAAKAPTRFDEKGNALPNIGQYLMGPAAGALKIGSGIAHMMTPTGAVDPVTASRLGEPEAAETKLTPDETAKRRSEVIQGFNDAVGGGFMAAGPLAMLDPAAVGAIPLYGAAAEAGQKALTKAGLKPQTAEAITNLALMFGPGVLHASRIEVPTDPMRDMAVGIMHEAAKASVRDYPNFGNMTEQGQETILSQKEQQVWDTLLNSNKVNVAKFAKNIGLDPSELYDFVKPDEGEEGPAKGLRAAPEGAEGEQAPPEPEPETSPVQETQQGSQEPSPAIAASPSAAFAREHEQEIVPPIT